MNLDLSLSLSLPPQIARWRRHLSSLHSKINASSPPTDVPAQKMELPPDPATPGITRSLREKKKKDVYLGKEKVFFTLSVAGGGGDLLRAGGG